MRVPQGIAHAIAILMYKVDTPNVLPLATVRWTSVIVTVVPCQTLWSSKSISDKGLRDGLYIIIPRRMTITPINGGVLPCPKIY